MDTHVARMEEKRYLQDLGAETSGKETTWNTKAQMGGSY